MQPMQPPHNKDLHAPTLNFVSSWQPIARVLWCCKRPARRVQRLILNDSLPRRPQSTKLLRLRIAGKRASQPFFARGGSRGGCHALARAVCAVFPGACF